MPAAACGEGGRLVGPAPPLLAALLLYNRFTAPCLGVRFPEARLHACRCAVLGGRLAGLAAQNGWAGIVINGCVRDSAALAQLPVGIKALAPCPLRSSKRDPGLKAVGGCVQAVLPSCRGAQRLPTHRFPCPNP